MEIEKALKIAKDLMFAATSKTTSSPWMITQGGIAMYSDEVMSGDEAAEFMKLLLNTFIDVHNSLSPEEDEDPQDAHNKYEIPFVRTLQKLVKERSHNFVQQWLDQHENDENTHLIDFGPTNNEPKKRTVKIDPAGETPIDDNTEEFEEDIPQIIINIGELNINLNE